MKRVFYLWLLIPVFIQLLTWVVYRPMPRIEIAPYRQMPRIDIAPAHKPYELSGGHSYEVCVDGGRMTFGPCDWSDDLIQAAEDAAKQRSEN